ncbi:redoxin domain-containing protein, partial [bacterium]|nr:redoxin domain-containing protein [bacterium]
MKTTRLTLATLAAVLTFAPAGPAPAQKPEAPKIGAVAPDFTLPPAAGGAPVALKDLLARSKAVVVIFDATKCPYALGYKERVATMGKEYAGKGVTFVTINSNKTEPAAEVAEDARKNGFAFPVLKDEGNKVADLYAAQKTPEIYVLDPKGTLLYRGRIDETHEDPKNVKSPDLR